MKHTLDFEIYTRGTEDTLIIIDTSEYFERPSNAIIEVEFPSLDEVFSAYFNPEKPNVLTTKQLGYSGSRINFPDGLYKLRYSVAPNAKVFKCKNYLKMDGLKNKLAEMIQSLNCPDKKDLDFIYDIDKYITAAEAVENTDECKALEFYNEANRLLNKKSCQ